MQGFRVCIIHQDGRVSVVDKAFSQVVELISGMTPETKEQFWDHQRVDLPNGGSVAFVKEV